MPKVFDWNGYRFHFFANEGNPREPMHIHIARLGAEAKFWLYPDIDLSYNCSVHARTIRRSRCRAGAPRRDRRSVE